MIRTLSILAALPCLAGCNLDDLINPGKASREAYEYRASITSKEAPSAPQPTQVAGIHVPAAVGVPEPVYVAPEPPEPYVPPPPTCQPVYAIYKCSETGDVIWL